MALPKRPPMDPKVFGDPAATRTEWTPLVKGGHNLNSRHLVAAGEALQVQHTLARTIREAVAIAAGVGLAAFGLWAQRWAAVLCGLSFAAVGVWKLRPAGISFDREQRELRHRKLIVPFERIVGLQVIRAELSDSDSSHESHELNVVLADGTRLNVLENGDALALRQDAQRLRQFLGVRLWDGSDPALSKAAALPGAVEQRDT